MNALESDTIVAVATPPGRGGVGIIRLSGPACLAIAQITLGKIPKTRVATRATFYDGDGQPLDQGLALLFKGPSSFTGEDVLELHGHGGPLPMDMLLQHCISLGARLAEPGEFSKRAFLNDKIDLTQAEAISDLIEAASKQAVRAAVHSLRGEFARRVKTIAKQLTELRIYVEAAIDFPEEEVDFLQDRELADRLEGVEKNFAELSEDAIQGCLLRNGMVIVLAGKPNVGKSSLLNRLAGFDAAIVTAQAGTTRDVLREDIHIDGMPLRIVDTAGLRDSIDPIEIEGIKRAKEAISSADHLLYLTETVDEKYQFDSIFQLPVDTKITQVVNKIDLSDQAAGVRRVGEKAFVFVSAKTGEGICQLRRYLKELMGFNAVDGGKLIARRRHVNALDDAYAHLREGKQALVQQQAGEIMAEELRLAQQDLGLITGQVTSDELLGEIFSNFCIGK